MLFDLLESYVISNVMRFQEFPSTGAGDRNCIVSWEQEKFPLSTIAGQLAGVMKKRILGETNPTVCCVCLFSFLLFTDSAKGMNEHRCSVFPKVHFTMGILIAAGKHLAIVRQEHSGNLYSLPIAKFPGPGAQTITLLFSIHTIPIRASHMPDGICY